jgi:hypothetical protein
MVTETTAANFSNNGSEQKCLFFCVLAVPFYKIRNKDEIYTSNKVLHGLTIRVVEWRFCSGL